MSVQDHHWTDAELTAQAQSNMDEILVNAGLPPALKTVVKSFFLNPDELGCAPGLSSMKDGVRRKMRELVPLRVLNSLPPDMPRQFLLLADIAFMDEGKFIIVVSRPDNSSTLAQRISDRTGFKTDDLSVDAKAPACGFDNLELMNRLHQIIMCVPNGGQATVQQLGAWNLFKYRSMLGAKRIFAQQGGDTKTIGLHEAVAHVAAFTAGKISDEYMGFMQDLRLPDVVVEYAYRRVTEQLVKRGHMTKESEGKNTLYNSVSPESLLPALGEVLDGFENKISANRGKRLSALYAILSVGTASMDEQKIVDKLTAEQIVEITSHFIAFQTVKGLKALLGDNAQKFAPQRGTGSFDRINKYLQHRLS
jgi:hypothetical protein